MKETRNILRNLLPAGIFYLYVVLLTCIFLLPYLFGSQAGATSALEAVTNWPVIAALAFFSPAIGQLLSIAHHAFFSSPSIRNRYPGINHQVFIDLNARKISRFLPTGINIFDTEPWVAINYLWHLCLSRLEQFGAFEERNNILSHITHSSGTTLIGVYCSLPVSLIITGSILFSTTQHSENSAIPFWTAASAALLLWFILMRIHWLSYAQACGKQEEFVELILCKVLRMRKPIRYSSPTKG